VLDEHGRALVRVATAELPEAIHELLAAIGAGLAVNRASVWEQHGTADRLAITYWWSRPGFAVHLDSLRTDEVPWLAAQLAEGRTVTFRDLGSLPPEALRDRKLLARHGPRSGALVPIVVGGEPIAALMVGTFHRERTWAPATLERLERAAAALGVALLRRRAHEAGLGTEGRLGGILEASPDGILLVHRGGRIELANGRAGAILGRTPRELAGARLQDLLDPGGGASRPGRSALEALLASEGPLQLTARRGDGSAVPVELTARSLRAPGEPLLCCGLRDATEDRRSREEATRLRNELAFVGRTAMLAEMAAGIAHELNQPLTAILSNAESAQRLLGSAEPADRAELGDALRDVVGDACRAADVLGRMRDMLRHRSPQRVPVDLRAVLEGVGRRFREQAVARSIRLSVEVPVALPAVAGDPVQLEQVLMNLVLNAFEAIQAGGGGPRAVALRARAGADGVAVSVRDTGPGLDAEALAHAFDSFFTTKPSGLGMGLAISRTIVEAHGGRLLARNNAEGGATFQLSLPAAEGTEAAREGLG
jgi:two-component system sensor kinase FixL